MANKLKTLSQIQKERLIILDGGMGSQIFSFNPTVEDYGGAEFEGCVELLNVNRKEWIQKIHADYLTAGADVIETNTFGCNELVLSEFGIPERAFELNVASVKLAKEVALSFDSPRFVIGSVGPGTKLLTLGHTDYDTLYKSYYSQMLGLITGGADGVLIETCQDIAQVKLAVRAARNAMKELKIKVPVWAQVTVETTGTMLVGSDIQSALTSLEMLDIDVLGMNCATGPDEMRQHLAYLGECSPFDLSCVPNAGLPINDRGVTKYPLGPAEFAEKLFKIHKDFGLNVVGGCCGTTPEHIKAVADRLQNEAAPVRKGKYERSVSSLYSSVPLDLEPKPLYVGERTNANGSKKFRDLLGTEDYDGLVNIARGQQREGAHLLDVCVAYVSRDEKRDMEEFLKRAVTQVNLPIMIDSTEVPVIERALQVAPGKCVVNSINFEDGDERAKTILGYCKEYGASIVALTIDEDGMAKTAEKKLEITDRLYNLAVKEFGLHVSDLIIDPLTFTLGSGDEEFRKSALETLNGIELIKKKYPGINTILGLSNVSFGLNPVSRQFLNSMMLYHSVKRGLDMAILNASKIIPVAKISTEDRKLFEDLLFDNRSEGYDPIKVILAKFADAKAIANAGQKERSLLTLEERLKLDIIDGEKIAIVDDALEALKTYKPLDIINNILLEGMKVVGERFGSGEMQLPFVLESAEAMKTAVRTLQPFMEKKDGYSKGKIIVATVKGDVHDIGKNLVDIILSNNGYDVVNMGIKQPVETIVEKYKETGADAIGLSGLLVKSTVVMKENLAYMAEHGFSVPVILGGAALTRQFVEEDCRQVYPGKVYYAFDAFSGLRLMEQICQGKGEVTDISPMKEEAKRKLLDETPHPEAPKIPAIKILRKGESQVGLDDEGRSRWVKKNEAVPKAPFMGTRVVEHSLEEVFDFLDEFALIRSRWSFSQGKMSPEAFDDVIKNKAEPLLKSWKEKIIKDNLLHPKGIYGYFPVCGKGNTIVVYHPDTKASTPPEKREVIAEFTFPRQESGRLLSLADFYRHESSGELDVMPVQIVSMGEIASQITKKMYDAGDFSDYFYFHGLSTELTEAYAERLHKQIRTELGVAGKDAVKMRQLFSQGYQGSRYSFGYPACPDMENNAPLLKLLGAERIGIELTENFQMVPEQTTSAIVSWHPQARYFST